MTNPKAFQEAIETRSSPVPATFSLHSFCKANNIAKSSAFRKAQALGIDTSKGLNSEDCERLKQAFGLSSDNSASTEEMQAIDAELVPESVELAIEASHIQTLDSDRAATLNDLHSRFAIKPFQKIEMNGDQASTVDLVAKLAATADAMAAENARTQAELEQRRQSNALAEQVLEGVAKEIKAQVAANADLQEDSEAVATQDAKLKKRLAALQALLD